jgi:DNA replication ATP-dependent helicase Dna2
MQEANGLQSALLPRWLQVALDPEAPLIWLDTRSLTNAQDSKVHGSLQNVVEANICTRLATEFVARSLRLCDLGITSPYSQQTKLIQGQVARAVRQDASASVMTIDKFQGQDRKAMAVSLVRSNASKTTGALLKDFRRVNVALTRAQTKLVIVGNSSTVTEEPTLAVVFQGVQELGTIIDLGEASAGFSMGADDRLLHSV